MHSMRRMHMQSACYLLLVMYAKLHLHCECSLLLSLEHTPIRSELTLVWSSRPIRL
jgi:hypothetical protein